MRRGPFRSLASLVEVGRDGGIEAQLGCVDTSDNIGLSSICTMLIDTGSNTYNFCTPRIKILVQERGGRIERIDQSVDLANNHSIVIEEVCWVEVCVTNTVLHRSTQKLIECFVTDLPGDADIVICWPTLKADSTLKSILFAQLVEVGNIDWIQALVAKARAGKQDWLDTKASDGTAHGLHDFDPGPSTVKQERLPRLVQRVWTSTCCLPSMLDSQ